MRKLFCAAVLVTCTFAAEGLVHAETPPSGTSCENVTSCQSECDGGNTASCVQGALLMQQGFGVAPDHGRAAAIFKRACDDKKVPRACLEYALASRDGWMFEVERSSATYAAYLERARVTGEARCGAGDADACYTRVILEHQLLDENGWPADEPKDEAGKQSRRFVNAMMSSAQKGCELGHGLACQWLQDHVDELGRRGYIKDKSSRNVATVESLTELADKGFAAGCARGDNHGCFKASLKMITGSDSGADADKARKKAIAQSAAACKRGHADSCLLEEVLVFFTTMMPLMGNATPPPDAAQQLTRAGARLAKALQGICGRVRTKDGREGCTDIAKMVAEGKEPQFGFDKPRPGYLRSILTDGCQHGNLEACEALAATVRQGLTGAPKGKDHKALVHAALRTCELTPFGDSCELCGGQGGGVFGVSAPKSRVCRTRTAWQVRTECFDGKEDRCEVLGHMYRSGDGIGPDLDRATGYFRMACDAALKSSCATLETLCRDDKKLARDARCQQSLIHTDVFYEAEWQFRQTGSAKILGEQKNGDGGGVGKVQVAGAASGGGGLELRRGKLDTDLVVSIVLDRARQAAIKLVVSELKRATRGKRVPIYLDDLLSQAALLLGDQSSMRREKFQDLAMTVVRSFVASNLVKTVYVTDDALLEAAYWAAWAGSAKLSWEPAKFSRRERTQLRAYLTDWAYYVLGQTPIFARAVGDKTVAPSCPFGSKHARVACQLMAPDLAKPDLERLSAALRIDAMLQGLSLAKALREEGSIDLRRFIESIGRSQTIANLKSTPGLNLHQWKKEIAGLTETQLRDLKSNIEAARALLTAAGWRQLSTTALKLKQTRAQALAIVGPSSPYLALFDAENVRIARDVLDLVARAELELIALEAARAELSGGGGLGLGGNSEELRAQRQLAVDQARQAWYGAAGEVTRALDGWSDAGGFLAKIEPIEREIAVTRPLITQLRRSVVEIETILRRYKPPRPPGADIAIEMESQFEISHVPLHALPDLRKHFQGVAQSLVDIDDHLGRVFPGQARPKLKFAVSAVVRLLGFFDLMERVARTARLNQTCGDVIEALRLLGSFRDKEFTAPLFDVMDPVLHAIKTHEPMDVDLLFTVISKVRLDSLLTNLAAEGARLCASGRGAECWTFKVVHSLQEAIQRSGDNIQIDGGAFAKRLASHGDDFRRKHKWRGYFHLTVGLGGLYSTRPPEVGNERMDGDDRVVPLIGEQIGFGWASPTFYNDTFTFKFGAYGSGILYRAALDSSESNAIMASPFVAIDLYDLIELYAGPMVLFYPPVGDKDAAVRLGVSAGLTVPLNAYLEKL